MDVFPAHYFYQFSALRWLWFYLTFWKTAYAFIITVMFYVFESVHNSVCDIYYCI